MSEVVRRAHKSGSGHWLSRRTHWTPNSSIRDDVDALVLVVCPVGVLLLTSCHAAAVDVNIRSFSVEAGLAYTWQLNSTLQSFKNVTLYGNATATATFTVVCKRVAAGTAYTVSGRVVISNTDSDEPMQVEAVRVLLGPGLPIFGPTPKTLDCKPRNLQPGATMSCPFKLQFSNELTRTVTASIVYDGRQSFTGEDLHRQQRHGPRTHSQHARVVRDCTVHHV